MGLWSVSAPTHLIALGSESMTTPSAKVYPRYRMSICKVCGSEFSTYKNLSCSKECQYALRCQIKKGKSTEERFWARVQKTDGCWLWTGTIRRKYGLFTFRKAPAKWITRGAHRSSWEIHYGPIPAGLGVLHKCDNPPCVRPDHLFLGTQKDNMDDRVAKGHGHISYVTAFGETKAGFTWTKDSRCKVPPWVIVERMQRGVPIEEAMSTPPTWTGPKPGRPNKHKD